jgi:uncharacterized protein
MRTAVSVESRIDHVDVTDETITARLIDGRVISVPLAWSWRLSDATPEQRANWQLIGNGHGVHWPDIDEDISANGMLHGIPAPSPRAAGPSTPMAMSTASGAGGAPVAECYERRYIGRMEPLSLTREEVVRRLRASEADIRALGVERLALFGSVLRNQAGPDSDVDLLVQFMPRAKTFDRFLELADLLEDRLGHRVELVTREALSPFLGPRIIAESQDVLGAA